MMVTLLLTAALLAPPEVSFSEVVWEHNLDIYREIIRHPFLKEMQDGSLAKETFAFYLVQDAYYLGAFGRALEATAAKAPKKHWADLLRRHARQSVEGERELQKSLLAEYELSMEEQSRMEITPEAFAYTTYIEAVAYSRPFGEALSVLLPCYWIYWEVGKDLAVVTSPVPAYEKWIDNYASDEYGAVVKEVLAIADEYARDSDPEERSKMEEHFRRASRYEWMFWDSSYRRPSWPPSR
jgi:thiaminase/transcriptional activator TenA